MVKALVAAVLIFGVLLGWIWVQGAYARFARRHPELGPFRSPNGGCCGGGCHGGSCERD